MNDEKENRAKARRYDRLREMAAAAEEFEGRTWAKGRIEYFGVMRSIRTDPELWFGGATNGRVRAEQISNSVRRSVAQIIDRRTK